MKTALCILSTALILSASLHAEDPSTPSQKAPKKPNPAAAFKKLDVNGDGNLDKAEFVAGKKDPEKAAKYFAKKDSDGNGSLTLEEFKAKAPKSPAATE